MPRHTSRPQVISNFVSTLDGVVSLNEKGRASGGPISGFNLQDRMVMGLLRAIADVVVVGAGTLDVDRRHVWTAEAICPELAAEYRLLRKALGKSLPPLNAVISGSGRINPDAHVFASGEVPALIVTTPAGERYLRKQAVPAAVKVRVVVGAKTGVISAKSIIDVFRTGPAKLILVEGGPRLLGVFYAEHLLDEQFLTLAPQIAGRESGDRRLSLVMGQAFAARQPLWGRLSDVRRGGSHLFLRYSFP